MKYHITNTSKRVIDEYYILKCAVGSIQYRMLHGWWGYKKPNSAGFIEQFLRKVDKVMDIH